jgi:uncharacterized membrane protein SpoIIM required for sporulation
MDVGTLGEVSWLAVLAAGAAWFVLGGAWYMAPPIAERWQRSGGIEVSHDDAPNPMVFLLTFLAYLVAAAVTAMLAAAIGVTTIGDGAFLGFAVGVGYALTGAAVATVYDRKPEPFTWFWINAGCNVVGLTVVGAVIGAFAG